MKKADATHAIEQISWRGSVIPIKNEKLRLALITAEELGKQTESGDGDIAEQIALYDKLSFQYSNAEDCVSKDPTISDLDKTCLRNYIAYLRTKKRIERTLMLATKKQASVDKQDLGPYPRKFHGDKADDLVRLYEILVQYVAQTGADEDDGKNQRVAAHQTFKAHRAFYMAVVFAKSRKYAESVVLFQYANTLLSKALQTHNSEAKPDTRLVSKINHLQQLGEQHLCEARARRLLGNSNEQSDSNYSSAALLENLNVYDASFLEKKTLMHFPPKQNVMGCKPIQFDIASNDCKFPDLEDRTKTKAKQGGWLSYFMGS